MKSLLILFILFASTHIYSQYTSIPDTNFEQALIDLGIDSDGIINGQVLTTDINFITYLNVTSRNISDLTGIEDFAALQLLYCGSNNLTSLNTSNNTALEELFCGSNNYTIPLDLSNNSQLKILECALSNLSSLDVSNNLLLENLYCSNEFDLLPHNTFTELDLSNNTNLKTLNAADLFYLEGLDLSNNPALEFLNVTMGWNPNPSITYLNLANGNNIILTHVETLENQELYCIQVDDEMAANNGEFPYSEWFINPEATFSEDCNLGIPDINSIKFSFYPNPVNNILNIINVNSVEINKISVFDILGKIVLIEKNSFDRLYLSKLESGIIF